MSPKNRWSTGHAWSTSMQEYCKSQSAPLTGSPIIFVWSHGTKEVFSWLVSDPYACQCGCGCSGAQCLYYVGISSATTSKQDAYFLSKNILGNLVNPGSPTRALFVSGFHVDESSTSGVECGTGDVRGTWYMVHGRLQSGNIVSQYRGISQK